MLKPNKHIEINGKLIGSDYPTYFIADIAANHDGDIEKAKELIFLAAEAGADAAKFQHFQAKTIVSDEGFKSLKTQQSHQAKWKKSVYEVYQDASVSWDWTEELKVTCEQAGIPFMTTPYSLEVIDFIDKFIPAYKIGSGDITWIEMIEKVASQNKPYFLATGASTMDEVNHAVQKALSINPQLGLMQCNTNYTASLENFKYIQLNVLKCYKEMYPDLVLGLSDHTPGHATVLGAVAMGARVIEKHFTDDISREGPDHAFSMDPVTWKDMVDRTRELEASMGSGIKKVEENELETVVVQRRSLRASANFEEGYVLKNGDFEALRPCPIDAITPANIKNIVGKKLKRKFEKGEYLRESDLD